MPVRSNGWPARVSDIYSMPDSIPDNSNSQDEGSEEGSTRHRFAAEVLPPYYGISGASTPDIPQGPSP